jgi:tetratricopeptide (TPR) repeat protein
MKNILFILLFGIVGCNYSDPEIYEESKKFFNSGDYQNCLNLSNSVPAEFLTQETYNHRAWSYAHLGKTDSASYEFEKVLLIDSTNQNAILGQLQFHPELTARIKYGYRYLRFQHDSAEIARVYQNIGHTYKELEDLNRAIEFYDSSINYLGQNLSIDDGYIFYKKGLAQFYAKQFLESKTSLSEYIKFRKDDDALKLLEAIKDSLRHNVKLH